MKMKPKTPERTEHDLFRLELVNMINLRHELVKLAQVIDWQALNDAFEPLYHGETGRPGNNIRLMCGLHYLKHVYALSDEEVCARWVENPYYQYFCGNVYFEHKLPINPSSMTRFRQRIGEDGAKKLLQLTVEAGVKTKTVKPASFKQVVVDTTVMEKAVAFPTDAKLLNRCREHLVTLTHKQGMGLRQSYARLGKRALLKVWRYGHARQFKRMRREVKRLKTYLGRVARDIQRRLVNHPHLRPVFEEKLCQAERLLTQGKTGKNKLYSLHAPEVECIAKGKAHKKYEFGVKVGIVTTLKEQFVLCSQVFPGRPYDGHTLFRSLGEASRQCGCWAEKALVDRGYRGYLTQGNDCFTIHIAGQKRGLTVHEKQTLKRRNAIEPIIGHMKTDGLLGRNYLLGEMGDAINAVLCGAGQNLRMILKKLRLLFVWILAQMMSHQRQMPVQDN